MRPPRLARWFLDRSLDADAAEAIGGDLTEEFQRRIARGRSPLWARVWFWRQTVVALAWRWRALPVRSHQTAGRRTMVETVWTETRQTFRALRRSPGFSLGAVVPLGLAVGLATAVFAVMHAVLLRPLPIPRPDRLVAVGEQELAAPVSNIGYETYLDLRDQASSFDGFAAIRGWSPTLTSPATTRLAGMRVTSGYFSMLGVRAALGRDFTAADDTPETRRVAILSDALWRRQFAADPSIINRVIKLNETEYRVIGVLPPSFEDVVGAAFYAPSDIWSPLGYKRGGDSTCRGCRHLKAVASIKPGVSEAAANEELVGLIAGYKRQFPADYDKAAAGVEKISTVIARPLAQSLYVLFIAVLLVLTIAAANAASLMVARAADQEHERALRSALGASGLQLIRQRAIEALLVAASAGAVGLAIGEGLTAWLVTHAPTSIPRAEHIGVNAGVVLFTLAAVALAALIIAVLPVLSGALRPVGRAAATPGRTTDGRARVHAREGLIVADVAIALMLAMGAGAMVRSVDRLLAVNTGFDPENVYTIGLSGVGPRWAEDEPVRVFQRDLVARVRALPGVTAVAIAGQVPLGGNYDTRGGYLEERQTDRAEDSVDFQRYSVTPDYLKVMGIPLKRGRFITEDDREKTPLVMVINETAAKKFWPDQDPIGKRVVFGSANRKRFVTVVGVTGDVRHYQLDQPPDPQMYLPQEQMTDSYMVLTVKTARFDDVLPGIRDAVHVLGPDVPVYDVKSMAVLVADSAATRRFTAVLLGVFAVVAALMTAAGLYGLVAYAVSRRTREFGIRIALGAQKSGIRRLVIARGALLTAAGGALGLLCSLPLTRLLHDQLYETTALDAAAVALGLVTLFVTSAIAHAVPVARATRVSPTIALRGE